MNERAMSVLEAASKIVKLHVKEDGKQAFAYYVTDRAPGSQVVYALESIKLEALQMLHHRDLNDGDGE
jgi:hypothetical protein